MRIQSGAAMCRMFVVAAIAGLLALAACAVPEPIDSTGGSGSAQAEPSPGDGQVTAASKEGTLDAAPQSNPAGAASGGEKPLTEAASQPAAGQSGVTEPQTPSPASSGAELEATATPESQFVSVAELYARAAQHAREAAETGGGGSSYVIMDRLPRDAIQAVFDPTFVTAEDGGFQTADGDLVIGLSVNGEHRAYPVAYMSRIEVANDVVGGKPVAVTW